MSRKSQKNWDHRGGGEAGIDYGSKEKGAQGETAAKVGEKTGTQLFPLSYSQWRLWYLDQFEPGSPAYNLSAVYRLKGDLRVDVMERALNEIVRRQGSLRTSFPVVDSEPVQLVKKSLEIPLDVIDLSAITSEVKEQRARTIMREAIAEPFDLSKGPLIRARLYRLDIADHLLMVSMHHIISDAWSLDIFYQELHQVYSAFLEGKPLPLQNLGSQYSDFAIWQRDWMKGDRYSQQMSYWKGQLRELPVLELPIDYARPRVRTHHGARVSLTLTERQTEAIQALSRSLNATSFMVLFGAFALLLHRHSGQTDLLTGIPVAGRNKIETEGLIGFFLNSLVLRLDLSKADNFKELVKQVRNNALDAFDNQDIPFEKIIEELNPPRDLNRTPIFQVFFNMFSVPAREPKLGNLRVERFPLGSTPSLFDLTVYVRVDQGRYRISFAYNTSLFSKARISAMLSQYQRLLEQVVADPGIQLSHYTLSDRNDDQALPDPTAALSSEWFGTIHEVVERHAQRTTGQTAISDRDGVWSYQELDLASSQIAQMLREQGCDQGDIVAIYAHRSAPLVAAILGIHKAGGVYLILDPAYPAPRLGEYLQVAQPVGIIQMEAAGDLPDPMKEIFHGSAQGFLLTIPVQAKSALLMGGAQASPFTSWVDVGPDDPACVVFTSGSTGKPKGILGRHGSLSHFLPWQSSTFKLSRADRFSMISGLSHDPLQRDIFTSLWVGGTLCIPDPDRFGEPGYLAEWMMEKGITFAHLTPPMAQYITTTANTNTKLDSIRYFFFVGDRLSREVVAHLREFAPQAEYINSFGSTETQRAVAYYCVPGTPSGDLEEASRIYPLGQGIPDAQLLVMNEAKSLCGIGELGEIYLRSPHLALGYLNDDEQTRTRFISNPFTNDPGDRLYKTGDLGRYRPDGNVDFAGRIDKQVKVRGFRIEPREIESALLKHSKIKNAVVLQLGWEAGAETLVAYFIPEDKNLPKPSELYRFLDAALPDFMIPSAYVPMEVFPLTPNGKIDETQLPVPENGMLQSGEEYVAPRTAKEGAVARIWSEILAVERVGVYDNFYALGGHSLLAIQIIAAMETEFGRAVPLSTLIQNPTVAGMLAGLEGSGETNPSPHLVPLRTSGARPPLFLIPPAASTAMRFERLAQYLGEDQPVYAFEYPGMDGKTKPLTSIPEMAKLYLQDILRIQPHGPYYVGGMCYGGMVAFEIAQQLVASGKGVNFLGILDSNTPPRRRKPLVYYIHNARQFIHKKILGRESLVGELMPRMHRRRVSKNDPLTRRIYRVFNANLYARLRYTSPPYPGWVTKFSTDWGIAKQATEGWRKMTTVGLEDHNVPGAHMRLSPDDTRMLDEPNVQVVAKKLRQCLESAPSK